MVSTVLEMRVLRVILGRQIGILLVVELQLIGRLCVEGRLASQALVDDRAQRPEICLGVVLQRHDDLGCLFKCKLL